MSSSLKHISLFYITLIGFLFIDLVELLAEASAFRPAKHRLKVDHPIGVAVKCASTRFVPSAAVQSSA